MNKKVMLIALLASLLVLLTACSLAQEEQQADPKMEDRFVGVYLIREKDGVALEQNEYWIEDGSETVNMGSVEFDLPRMILTGKYDEENHCYRFPGVEGYALFTAEVKDEKGDYCVTCSDLQDVSTKAHTHAEDMDVSLIWDGADSTAGTEEGYTDYELSGTLYVAATLKDSVWKLAHVYQKEDGTVYLDGTGDCYSFGSFGGSVSVKEEVSQAIHGETVSCGTTEVTVSFEEAKASERTTIYWYTEAGELLSTQLIDPEKDTELHWKEGASWMILEEVFAEETKHTAYDMGTEEEPLTLKLMQVNEAGLGEVRLVEIIGR